MAGELVAAQLARRLAADRELSIAQADDDCVIVSRPGARRVMAHRDPRNPGGVLLYAAFAHHERLSPRLVLLMADRIRAGALALVGDRYVVRFALSAAQLDSPRLLESVRYVGDLAARLARSVAGIPAETNFELFSHFTE